MNSKFSTILFHFRFRYKKLKNELFNKTVIEQNKSFKNIPIIIISFNQLFYLKKLINFLLVNEYKNIVIIDNNSTYKPLLHYFNEIEKVVKVYRLKENYGYRVFWNQNKLFAEYSNGYYVITDPDIIPIKECPSNFLQYFKWILDRNPQMDKVGFSLRIDNIPNSNPNKAKIIGWEKKYWIKTDNNGNYISEIDTTFALYRPGKPFVSYKAIRSKYPYLAIHEGWYIDPKNLTKEQEYYFKTANESASWKMNPNGELVNKIFLNTYNK